VDERRKVSAVVFGLRHNVARISLLFVHTEYCEASSRLVPDVTWVLHFCLRLAQNTYFGSDQCWASDANAGRNLRRSSLRCVSVIVVRC